jgi:hypothetical protein
VPMEAKPEVDRFGQRATEPAQPRLGPRARLARTARRFGVRG